MGVTNAKCWVLSYHYKYWKFTIPFFWAKGLRFFEFRSSSPPPKKKSNGLVHILLLPEAANRWHSVKVMHWKTFHNDSKLLAEFYSKFKWAGDLLPTFSLAYANLKLTKNWANFVAITFKQSPLYFIQTGKTRWSIGAKISTSAPFLGSHRSRRLAADWHLDFHGR